MDSPIKYFYICTNKVSLRCIRSIGKLMMESKSVI